MKRALAVILSVGTVGLTGCGTAGLPTVARTVAAPIARSQSVDGIKTAVKHLSVSEFTAMDRNRDGAVTQSESQMSNADFTKVDTNGDGQIARTEQDAFYERISDGLYEFMHEESGRNFAKADRNANGYLTIEEYRATLPQDPHNDHTRYAMGMFNTSDVNHDRQMDLSEFEDFEMWFIASLYDLDGIGAATRVNKLKAAVNKRVRKAPTTRR
jgi:Ca2+-binding EF-hand superfamily protein